ncbi:MAG TPA: glycine cleavage T C-terminal barrel domain-containing protein [Candidatus Acidoferrales bacterium]|nr:glycine cleavage T C-terminal barrel domain-containing protein [Candidatus Acidoferrales bacterium]
MALESPLRVEHEKAGAQLAVYFDCLLPERFTDLGAEYRQARETVALVDTNYRAFVYLQGPDRARYLNAMLTNNVKDLAPGQGGVSLLLNPQGHILAEIETYALEDCLLAVFHAVVRERTVATLEKLIIMDDVTLDDATEKTASLLLIGPQAAKVVGETAGIEPQKQDYSHVEVAVEGIPCRVVRRLLSGHSSAELFVAREAIHDLWEAMLEAVRARGGGPIGYAALNVLRLEAGVPWFGYDFDDKAIPHEAALEATHVSYTKGCYTGQEIVERVRSRGHVNRRRVGLQFSGASAPDRGAKLFAAGQEAGYVTSAAYSPALERAIGMAYIRREHNTPGSHLEWGGGEAEVIELPLTGLKTTLGQLAT